MATNLSPEEIKKRVEEIESNTGDNSTAEEA